MLPRRVVLPALGAAVFLAVTACGGGSSTDDEPRIVAGAYPFAFVAQKVAGNLAEVDNLTRPGVEPHDVELTPKQVGEVSSADLVVYLTGFQSAVDGAVHQADLPTERRLDVADVVEQVPFGAHDAHEAGVSDNDEHGTDEGEHDHEHDGLDPHVWLDPVRMTEITRAVADRLVDLDPDHASTYRANADALVAQLDTLGSDFAAGLKTCEIRDFVTSHAAFGYLAGRYDLTQIPIAGVEPNTEPSSRTLASIVDLVERHDITTVFTEELTSPRIADTIARATGATTAVLSPLEGLTKATSHEDYLTLMRANLAALQKANRCS